MTVSTLRPNGGISNTGTVVGGGTSYGALSDNSDLTYISCTEDEGCAVTLGDFTLPADAVVKSVGWRIRSSAAGGAAQVLQSNFLSGSEVAVGSIAATWTTPTTTTIRSGVTEFASGVTITDALIDAGSLSATNTSPGSLLLLEAYVDVTYVTQPTVGVGQPTGTITTNTSPDVVWLQSIDSAGGNVTAFEVKVYTAAQYGAGGFDPDDSEATVDSGVVGDNTAQGFNAWEVPMHLPNATYRVYVRVRQTVNGADHWSDWDFEGFVVNVTRPDAPTLTLTPDDSAGRVLIEVEEGDDPLDLFYVERSDDGGGSWVDVRTGHASGAAFLSPVAGAASVYDYEGPNGVSVSYRVSGIDVTELDPLTLIASAYATGSAMWEDDAVWLKDPANPELNVRLSE